MAIKPGSESVQSDDAAERASENTGTTTQENQENTPKAEEIKNRFIYPLRMLQQSTDMLSITIFDVQPERSNVFGVINKGGKEKSDVKNLNLQGLVNDLTNIGGTADRVENIFGDSSVKETQKRAKELQKNAQYILLPIPQSVSDSLSVDYASDTLSPVDALGMNVTRRLIDSPNLLGKTAEIGKQIADALSTGSDLGPEASNAIATALSGKVLNTIGSNVSPNSLLSRSQGLILQSNLELLFSGVQLRSFPFIFDFSPRDPAEAEEVRQIIRVIKQAMSPRKSKNPSLFINSPKAFKFAYLHQGKEHPFLNKFKTGFLTSMNVDYTASGTYATYDKGVPVHMRMTLQFTEMNPIYADDYNTPAAGSGVGY